MVNFKMIKNLKPRSDDIMVGKMYKKFYQKLRRIGCPI